jgi:predicted metalloendopeptidase
LYRLANVTLNHTDRVSISELEYIRNISALVEQESPRTIQNYLIWRFLMSHVQLMSKTFRSIQQDFARVFRGTSLERPRALICATTVNDNMGLAVSKLYLEKYFDRAARIEVSRVRSFDG